MFDAFGRIDPVNAPELVGGDGVEANRTTCPLSCLGHAEVVQDAWEAEYLQSGVQPLVPIESVLRRTWPHLVMRGADGGERQIGQVVLPSSAPCVVLGVELASASADARGTMT